MAKRNAEINDSTVFLVFVKHGYAHQNCLPLKNKVTAFVAYSNSQLAMVVAILD